MKRKLIYEIEHCFECPYLICGAGYFHCAQKDGFSIKDVQNLKDSISEVFRWFQSEKCPLEKS